jgi:shikimate kinase
MEDREQKQNQNEERVLARVLSEELKVTTGGGVMVTGDAVGNLNGSDITDSANGDRQRPSV